MLINKTFRKTFLLAALLSSSVVPAVNADESTTTTITRYGDSSGVVQTTTTTTTKNDPPPTAATPAASSDVFIRTASPDVLVTTIDSRRKNLEDMIDASVVRGDITAEKAASMKRELGRIDRGVDEPLSHSKAVMYAQDLDHIGDQYKTIVTTPSTTQYVPIINGTNITITTGQTFKLDDLSVRRAELEKRVVQDLLQRRLSDSQAARIRSKLESLGNEQALYNASGSLNDKEAKRLYGEFDKVAKEIDRIAGKENTKDRNPLGH
jgi:hypothetical protein